MQTSFPMCRIGSQHTCPGVRAVSKGAAASGKPSVIHRAVCRRKDPSVYFCLFSGACPTSWALKKAWASLLGLLAYRRHWPGIKLAATGQGWRLRFGRDQALTAWLGSVGIIVRWTVPQGKYRAFQTTSCTHRGRAGIAPPRPFPDLCKGHRLRDIQQLVWAQLSLTSVQSLERPARKLGVTPWTRGASEDALGSRGELTARPLLLRPCCGALTICALVSHRWDLVLQGNCRCFIRPDFAVQSAGQ